MAEKEVYRIEIPIVVDDQTAQVLEKAGLRVTKFEKQVERTRKQIERTTRTRWDVVIGLVDRASTKLREIGSRARSIAGRTYNISLRVLDYATRPLRAIGGMLTSTLGLLGIGATGWGAVIWPTKLADELETTRIGFETMLKSAKEADKFMQEIQQFAKDTPFGQKEVVELGKALLVRGFERAEVIPMLRIIGDVAAAMGTGTEGIDRMIYAFGQMKALGKVSAEEMNQLTEAGVRAWDYLARGLGKSIAETRKLSEQGKIAADVAIKHILAGMREYEGMMEKAAERTVGGLWGQIQDMLQMNVFTRWGQGIQSALVPALKRVVDWIDVNDNAIKRWGDTLERVARDATQWVVERFSVAFEYVRKNYLENPEFKKLDFQGKIAFVFDDLMKLAKDWYNREGREQLKEIGKWLGETLADGIEGAAPRIADAAILLGRVIATTLIETFLATMKESVWGSILIGAVTGAAIGGVTGVGALPMAAMGALGGWWTYQSRQTTQEFAQRQAEKEAYRSSKEPVKSGIPYRQEQAMKQLSAISKPSPFLRPTGIPPYRYADGGPILGPTLLVSAATGRPYALAGEAGPEWVVPVRRANTGQIKPMSAASATTVTAKAAQTKSVTVNGPLVQMSVTVQGINGEISDEHMDKLAGRMADALQEVLANMA